MKVGDRIRMALRSFLQIDPADGTSFYIKEALSWEARAIEHRLWYRGEASELNQFYGQLSDGKSSQRFWAAKPTSGWEIRKAHTGLPKIIINTLTALILADLNEITFPKEDGSGEDDAKKERWEEICAENSFSDLLADALHWSMVIGDGAFKLSIDPKLSKMPILEWWDGDHIELVYQRGRVREVVFTSHYKGGYVLQEHYGYGYVHYELFRNEQPVALNSLEETANLVDVKFSDSYMLAVPFQIRSSAHRKGRGESFFAGKTDAFDALDEAFSQWVQGMRSARPKEYIPESLIPRDPKTGELLKPNPFDNQFARVNDSMTEGDGAKIILDQASFFASEYNSTYSTALDLALQGLISPSTLGIDTKKLDNAEAQREKEKVTLYTRQEIIAKLTPVLQQLVDVTFRALAEMNHQTPRKTQATVTFGEYANPSFEAVVETLSNPNTPMSIEAKVDELWGDTKDDEWKKSEVRRIREEQGFADVEQPAVSAELMGQGGV